MLGLFHSVAYGTHAKPNGRVSVWLLGITRGGSVLVVVTGGASLLLYERIFRLLGLALDREEEAFLHPM